MKQIVSVKAIIKKDNKVLFVRSGVNANRRALLGLPGNIVSYGYDPKDAMRNYIQDVLGLVVESLRLVDVKSKVDSSKKEQELIMFFCVEVEDLQQVGRCRDCFWKELSNKQLNGAMEDLPAKSSLMRISKMQDKSISEKHESVVDTSTKISELIIFADGGSRGNPGPSAYGFVIKDVEGKTIFEHGGYMGVATNNQAEYQAVRAALEKAAETGAEELHFKLDSQLVVNQMKGVYKVKNAELKVIYDGIKSLELNFKKVTFTHIRREFNKEADSLVNKTLDARM